MEELASHRAEERALRSRIVELEAQLAATQDTSKAALPPDAEHVVGNEAPEVVAVIQVGSGRPSEDKGQRTKSVETRPAQQGARESRSPSPRREMEDLTIRRNALQVLLRALDDAVAQGILSQDNYRAKRLNYRRELRRVEKTLAKTPTQARLSK